MKSLITLAACVALLATSPALAHGAQEHGPHEHGPHEHGPHEHGPHEHGVARLNVAVDGTTLSIDLESPLANALPFEHAPSTPAQREAVQTMAATLHKAEDIFTLPPAAQCRLKNMTLESEALPADLLAATASPQQAEPEHANHADHEAHAEHAAGAEHADLDASFIFECAKAEALNGMDVNLFSVWPALHELRVQIVSPSGQHAAELTAKARTLQW